MNDAGAARATVAAMLADAETRAEQINAKAQVGADAIRDVGHNDAQAEVDAARP